MDYEIYSIDGVFHSEDGPAFSYPSGVRAWYQFGQLHRLDGPAIVYDDGNKEWWIDGVRYEAMEWLCKIHDMGENTS